MAYAVYFDPKLNQTWADGSPVLWSATIDVASENEARAVMKKGPYKDIPIVFVHPKLSSGSSLYQLL